jgi:hypothetical protein
VLIGSSSFPRDRSIIVREVFKLLDSHSHSLIYLLQHSLASIKPQEIIQIIQTSATASTASTVSATEVSLFS